MDKITEVNLKLDGFECSYIHRYGKICNESNCNERENLEVLLGRDDFINEYIFVCSKHKKEFVGSKYREYES